MSSALGAILAKSRKYQLWQEAHIFSICRQTVWDWCKKHIDLHPDSLQIFTQSSHETIKVTIASQNNNLVSWLRTHHQELLEQLTSALQAKKILHNQTIKLLFKRSR